MGLHASTAYNKRARCKNKLIDIISAARMFRSTHKKILEDRACLFESNDWKPLSRADKEYLRGYFDAAMFAVERYELEWRMWVNLTAEQLDFISARGYWNIFTKGDNNGIINLYLFTKAQIKKLEDLDKDLFKNLYCQIDNDKSVSTWIGYPDYPFNPKDGTG